MFLNTYCVLDVYILPIRHAVLKNILPILYIFILFNCILVLNFVLNSKNEIMKCVTFRIHICKLTVDVL